MIAEKLIEEIQAEMDHGERKHGRKDYWDGCNPSTRVAAEMAKRDCDEAAAQGKCAWSDILLEETMEAMAETDTARLRAELIQVAAVAVRWINSIDRRKG